MIDSVKTISHLLEGENKEHIEVFEGHDSHNVLKAAKSLYKEGLFETDQACPMSLIKITPKDADSTETIGIIGGMGPMATFYFLDVLYQSLSVPTITFMCTKTPDRGLVYKNPSRRAQLEELFSKIGQILITENGCSQIMMPCNTAHIFSKDIPRFQSLIAATTLHLKQQNISSIVILSTSTTVESALYSQCTKNVMYPDPILQSDVNTIIYDEIKRNLSVTPKARHLFKNILTHFVDRGYSTFALCCTELPLVATDSEIQAFIKTLPSPITFIDPMKSIALNLKNNLI